MERTKKRNISREVHKKQLKITGWISLHIAFHYVVYSAEIVHTDSSIPFGWWLLMANFGANIGSAAAAAASTATAVANRY